MAGLFALSSFSFEVEKRRVAEAKAKSDAVLRKNEEDRQARLRAVPPSGHLNEIQQAIDLMKKVGFTEDQANRIRLHASFIPKDAPEFPFAVALAGQIGPLKKLADARKVAAAKEAERKLHAEWRKTGVSIGMPAERVRYSSWGRPDHINRSVYRDGVQHEQWCYSSGSFLYFEDGILTGIQN